MSMNLHTTRVPLRKDGFDDTYLLSLRNVISRDEYTEILTRLNASARPFTHQCDKTLLLIFIPMAFMVLSIVFTSASDTSPEFVGVAFGGGFVAMVAGIITFAVIRTKSVNRARHEMQSYLRELNEDYASRGVQLRILESTVLAHNDGSDNSGARTQLLSLEVTVDLNAANVNGGNVGMVSGGVLNGLGMGMGMGQAGPSSLPSAPPPYMMARGMENAAQNDDDTAALLVKGESLYGH